MKLRVPFDVHVVPRSARRNEGSSPLIRAERGRPMANPQRLRRVADQIQRELSELLRAELKDPRVGMITLTGVEVSPDLAYAKVFFTTLADSESLAKVEAGLQGAPGFPRAHLGKPLRIPVT